MSEFKVEYELGYSKPRYRIYRKEYIWFGFRHIWVEKDSFNSLKDAEDAMQELKKYPKYYSWN